jgi:hypothetical protein
VIHSNFAMQFDTLKMFNTMWYLQTVLCHVIPSNCLISCDTFKLFYTIWYLQIVHAMWYLEQTFFIPCDAFNLFYTMWYLQVDLYHVIHSNFVMQYHTLKMFNTMGYLQTVLYHVISSNYSYHVIPSTNCCLYYVILSICFIPYDAFKLFYNICYF